MTVRAKFVVNSVKLTKYGADAKTMYTVEMSPVYSSDPNSENKKFWDFSPSGSFVLGTINASAAAELEIGKEFYIDITPAPAATPSASPSPSA